MNVIDFDRLALHRPEAAYDLPTGGKRLIQHVDGYRQIVKSGQVTFEDGRTGAIKAEVELRDVSAVTPVAKAS